MANPKVWVSTTGDVDLGGDGPGARWELVGTIDPAQERELWKHMQAQIGLRASSPRVDGFYLHGTPSSAWVVRARDHADEVESFWVAIDPLGDGAQYLATAAPATLGALARHPTESHRGLRERAVTLGIRLRAVERRVFNLHRP